MLSALTLVRRARIVELGGFKKSPRPGVRGEKPYAMSDGVKPLHGLGRCNGVGLESRRGRDAVCVCEEGVAWHVGRAEWAVRVGADRRAVAQEGKAVCS